MKPPLLLCYHLPETQASQTRLIAMRYRIRVRVVHDEELGQPLAALCGLQPSIQPAPQADAFADPMLVMAFFPMPLANQFLLALKKAKLPPISLKAILTDTNAEWSSAYLRDQLSAERDAIEAGARPAHDPT